MTSSVTTVCETQSRGSKAKADSFMPATRGPSITRQPLPLRGPESSTAAAAAALAEDEFTDSSNQKGVDSGYASLQDTPTRLYPEPCNGRTTFVKKQIKSYDKEISEAHRHRFSDLQELFGPDLRRHLLKKLKGKQDLGTIVWRLKCLGETEESACPWILILCNESVADAIRKYLKKSKVKDECHPSDKSLPSFNVYVCSLPLKDLGSQFVFYEEAGQIRTLCGKVVYTFAGDKTNFATLGGVIKIVDGPTMTNKFLGMTAGHIVDPQSFHCESDAPLSTGNTVQHSHFNTVGVFEQDKSEHSDDSSDDDSGDEESQTANTEIQDDYEFELDLEEIEEISKTVQLWEANRVLRQAVHLYPDNMAPARYHSSSAVPLTGRDLDWVLFDIDHVRPNLIQTDPQSDPIVIHKVSRLRCEAAEPGTPVSILTSHGTRMGILQSSAFMLRPGTLRPINTFVVRLTSEDLRETTTGERKSMKSVNPLHPGDSGSWVVAQATNEVIGYVLASDVFQDVYVVPLQSALDDIKQVTGATSCGLFDTDDQQYRHRATDKTTPEVVGDSGYASLEGSPSMSDYSHGVYNPPFVVSCHPQSAGSGELPAWEEEVFPSSAVTSPVLIDFELRISNELAHATTTDHLPSPTMQMPVLHNHGDSYHGSWERGDNAMVNWDAMVNWVAIALRFMVRLYRDLSNYGNRLLDTDN